MVEGRRAVRGAETTREMPECREHGDPGIDAWRP